MHTRGIIASIGILLGAGFLAAGAGAATPISVGQGADVAIEVDAAGTAHVAWRQGSPHAARYCRVPKGHAGPGCPATPETFPPRIGANSMFGRVLVGLRGSTVVVMWRECCGPEEVNSRISTDLGDTFAPIKTLAENGPPPPVSTSGDATMSLDGTTIGWTNGLAFQAAALGAPPVTTRANLFGPVSFGGVSALVAGLPLVVEESDAKLLRFRRFVGPTDVNDAANWTAAPGKSIPTSGTGFKRPSLGFDPADAFLAYTDSAGAGKPDRPFARRYVVGDDEFGARVRVADQAAGQVDLAVGGTGRVHVVWSSSSGIWWSFSDDRGASFTAPIPLTTLGGVTHLHAGAGGDGSGFAAFRTIDGTVRVIALEASSEFRFGRMTRHRRRGSASLVVRVPGPGVVRLAATRAIRGARRARSSPGTVTLPIRAKPRVKRKLRRRGRARVAARVTFAPVGGAPRTKVRSVQLRMVRRRR